MGRKSTPGVVARRASPKNLGPSTSTSEAVRDLFAHARKVGVSSAELASRTGFSAVTLSRWRTGRTSPEVGVLDILARAVRGRIVFETKSTRED